MVRKQTLFGADRRRLLDDLHDKYESSNSKRRRLTYLRKKYAWLLVVKGTKLIKRVIDITLSLVLLIALFPLLLLICLLIKLTDFGPIFYVTKRVGKWGKEFSFPKFRSMCTDAEELRKELFLEKGCGSKKRFKHKRDPRVTWIGRIIRRTSLDELPQLWCVLKGEMSLVGPRPPLPDEVTHYTLEERRRLEVSPGLTCIWQVSGRSNLPFEKQVRLDLQYIESQNIFLDLFILLRTIPAVILGKGAY